MYKYILKGTNSTLTLKKELTKENYPNIDIDLYEEYDESKIVIEDIPQVDDRANRICELKAQLNATDFKAIKYAEGLYTEEEYAPIRQERELLREEIRRLENEESIYNQ